MSDFQAPDEWNAGNTGCGELLVKLFLRMRALRPGVTGQAMTAVILSSVAAHVEKSHV
jgi:hypothetical protein